MAKTLNPDYGRLRREAVQILTNVGVDNPALDVRLLLQAASGKTAADLIACDRDQVEDLVLDRFHELMGRRAAHEPVAYILGAKPFWTAEFIVNEHVLVPRPETEGVVREGLARIKDIKTPRILDVGTGSGAILISLLHERQDAFGVGVDISNEALAIARQNAVLQKVVTRTDFYRSDFLAGVDEKFDLVVSNPPYITKDDLQTLPADVELYEPGIALDGGTDGLRAYRRICAGLGAVLNPGGCVVFEIGSGQKCDVLDILTGIGAQDLNSFKDLAGHDRILSAKII